MSFFKFSRVQRAWEYRSEPDALRMLAMTFWRTLLLLVFLVLLVALWFGWQELNAASQAESVAPASAEAPLPWTLEQLQRQVDALSAKQTVYQTLSQSPMPAIADPSK
jgi:predicted negative regulator of RcsB-dependent stress response